MTLDAELMATEAAVVVNQAIASLPPDQREPIQLAFHQGLSYRAIAVHLGIPEGTIKSRIRSALRHLRDYIQLHQSLEDERSVDSLNVQGTDREAVSEAAGACSSTPSNGNPQYESSNDSLRSSGPASPAWAPKTPLTD
jgi:hypothetical protein